MLKFRSMMPQTFPGKFLSARPAPADDQRAAAKGRDVSPDQDAAPPGSSPALSQARRLVSIQSLRFVDKHNPYAVEPVDPARLPFTRPAAKFMVRP